jgi:hypothetical protein
MVNGAELKPRSQPVPLQPSFSIPSRSTRVEAGAGARRELRRRLAHDELDAAGEASDMSSTSSAVSNATR